MRPWMAIAALLPGFMLAACQPAAESGPAPIDADNPLEQAARDAYLVADPDAVPIAGLYQRRHASGTDSLCVTGGGDEGLRFGVVASFGATLRCEGTGEAELEGEKLRLSFRGGDCVIDARYDGEHIAMPGTVPAACAALCGPRASLSGVTVARKGEGDGIARSLRSDRNGRTLCS